MRLDSPAVSRAVEEQNRRLLRARDAMDRAYAEPLAVPALARIARVSEAHFIRTFRATFGETPHRYLQRRRVDRAPTAAAARRWGAPCRPASRWPGCARAVSEKPAGRAPDTTETT